MFETMQREVDTIVARAEGFFDYTDSKSDYNDGQDIDVDAIMAHSQALMVGGVPVVTPAMQTALRAHHEERARFGGRHRHMQRHRHDIANNSTQATFRTPTSLYSQADISRNRRGRFITMVLYHLYHKLAF